MRFSFAFLAQLKFTKRKPKTFSAFTPNQPIKPQTHHHQILSKLSICFNQSHSISIPSTLNHPLPHSTAHLSRTPQRVTIAQFHLSLVNCISYPLPRLRKPCPTCAQRESSTPAGLKKRKTAPLGDSVHFKMAAWGVVSVITK